MTTKNLIPKKTKSTKAKKPLAIRFVMNDQLEFIMNELEQDYIGLNRSEIIKFAINRLYRERNEVDDIIEEIKATPRPGKTEDEMIQWWSQNKYDLRS
jgi:hypothetical protein